MARLRKKVAQRPPVKEVAAAVAASKKENTQGLSQKDRLFYIVPPVILLLIFFFCAKNSRPSRDMGAKAIAANVAQSPTKNKVKAVTPVPTLVIPADVNNDLPAYVIEEGRVNVLAGGKAQAAQSGYARRFPAKLAIDGSTKNDDLISVAEAVGGRSAWWQAEVAGNGAAVSSIVIYGGGSASPAGKLLGGFEVIIEDVNGEVQTRKFNEQGFALEGHEEWQLEAPFTLKTIRINSLAKRTPVTLREVLAISPSAQ